MYVSSSCRSLLYRLLVGLCRHVPSHCLSLLQAMTSANDSHASGDTNKILPHLPAPPSKSKANRGLSDEAVAGVYTRIREALACMPLRQVKWDYDPDSQLRDPRMHVGLKNQVHTLFLYSTRNAQTQHGFLPWNGICPSSCTWYLPRLSTS